MHVQRLVFARKEFCRASIEISGFIFDVFDEAIVINISNTIYYIQLNKVIYKYFSFSRDGFVLYCHF